MTHAMCARNGSVPAGHRPDELLQPGLRRLLLALPPADGRPAAPRRHLAPRRPHGAALARALHPRVALRPAPGGRVAGTEDLLHESHGRAVPGGTAPDALLAAPGGVPVRSAVRRGRSAGR